MKKIIDETMTRQFIDKQGNWNVPRATAWADDQISFLIADMRLAKVTENDLKNATAKAQAVLNRFIYKTTFKR